ncbi:hypothetical protein ACN9MN_06155 [Chryseobacterium sp. S-02]|uniref:hypothetical protein n=1 Tax=Chryseobacterium sp. S-02 TaxID=3404064 RepID=UPI003CEDEC8D
MSSFRAHIHFYKAITILSLLAFSLSPCSVKRDVLNIFDIQYFGTLNKVKATAASTANCDASFQNSSATSKVKAHKKVQQLDFSFHVNLYLKNPGAEKTLPSYSKTTTGNSPPKYILFKRLKLDLI